MMHHHPWYVYLALIGAFLAIGAIIAVASNAHSESAATIYTAVQAAHHDGSAPNQVFGGSTDIGAGAVAITPEDLATSDNSTLLRDVGSEGVRWAHNARVEANVWAIVLVIVLLVVLFYGGWYSRRVA